MAVAGDRFTVNLSDDEEPDHPAVSTSNPPPSAGLFLGMIGDIKERDPSGPPPELPQKSASGFPAHKKRTGPSAFQRSRMESTMPTRDSKLDENAPRTTAHGPPSRSTDSAGVKKIAAGRMSLEQEMDSIDRENRSRLQQMSEKDIMRERQELLDSLDPSLVQNLLKRANLDDQPGNPGINPHDTTAKSANEPTMPSISSPRQVSQSNIDVPISIDSPLSTAAIVSNQSPGPFSSLPEPPSVHFPNPPQLPDLDPSDPSFLENLHAKYFPTLAADPSKLAWMAPIPTPSSTADLASPYSPAQSSIPPSAIRFDFRGSLLPPRAAREIPVTKGLHHHGEAPEAAGYTIPELARLARSAFPSQRAMAFQTLGRILYRLGKGQFGEEGDMLVMGLWRCVEEGRVLDTLQQEAGKEGGHVSCKAHATEAVWNWQKGGGKKWKAQ